MGRQEYFEDSWGGFESMGPPIHLFQLTNQHSMCMEEEDFVTTFYQQRLGPLSTQQEELDFLEALFQPLSIQREGHEELIGV